MPSATVFAQLGFFVRRGFLDETTCSRLIAQASAAPFEPSRVVQNGVDHVLDEGTRKTLLARVDRSTQHEMRDRFATVIPDLERHAGTAVDSCEPPGFLI